jgi:predicted Zn-dependent protease
MSRALRRLSAAILMICFFLPAKAAAPADGALSLLSKSEERKIGRRVIEEVDRHFKLIDDPYVTLYLKRIGDRVLAPMGAPQFETDFHVVADSVINAFAVPGGHVFLTSQAVLLCGDESELAGIVAHELGHVEGRHLAQRVESATRVNLATLAAIIAAAFLGSPQAGAAVSSFAIAAAQTKMLQYSRADEEDADRRAVRALTAAGYDGWGLVRFMETLRRQSPAPEGVPAYLFTHPLPENREAYLAAILPPPPDKKPSAEQLGPLWRTQARILVQDPRSWGFSLFETRVRENPESPDARLGLALLLSAQGRYGEAQDALQAARRLRPSDPEIAHESAMLELRQGHTEKALADLEALRAKGEATPPALMDLGWAYLEAGQGEKALAVYDDLASREPRWKKNDYYRGLALGKAGHEGEAHALLGDYYGKEDQPELAARHYREALKKLPAGDLRTKVEDSLRRVEARERRQGQDRQ